MSQPLRNDGIDVILENFNGSRVSIKPIFVLQFGDILTQLLVELSKNFFVEEISMELRLTAADLGSLQLRFIRFADDIQKLTLTEKGTLLAACYPLAKDATLALAALPSILIGSGYAAPNDISRLQNTNNITINNLALQLKDDLSIEAVCNNLVDIAYECGADKTTIRSVENSCLLTDEYARSPGLIVSSKNKILPAGPIEGEISQYHSALPINLDGKNLSLHLANFVVDAQKYHVGIIWRSRVIFDDLGGGETITVRGQIHHFDSAELSNLRVNEKIPRHFRDLDGILIVETARPQFR